MLKQEKVLKLPADSFSSLKNVTHPTRIYHWTEKYRGEKGRRVQAERRACMQVQRDREFVKH